MLLDFKSPYISDTAKLADGRDELALKGKTRKMQHWKFKKKTLLSIFPRKRGQALLGRD